MKRRTPAIENFLNSKRIAFVGISRDPADFSRTVYKELVQRGYDVVPVRPDGAQVVGARTFARVQEISPPVEAALIMTPPTATDDVVRDCAQAGIRKVWLHRGMGPGSATESAIRFCNEQGIEVVSNVCPMMFLSETAGVHRFHGFLRTTFSRPQARA